MDGWVYILSNPSFADGRIKIGYSSSDPKYRIIEFNKATGVPEDFQLEYQCYVEYPRSIERKIHRLLADKRPHPRKEFFIVPIQEAIDLIESNAIIKHKDNPYAERHPPEEPEEVRSSAAEPEPFVEEPETLKEVQQRGEYRDDNRHGQGTHTYADGRIMEGIWENGEFGKSD